MISYTHRSVTAVSFLITILIFSIISFSYKSFYKIVSNSNFIQNNYPINQENKIKKTSSITEKKSNNVTNNKTTNNTIKNETNKKTNSTNSTNLTNYNKTNTTIKNTTNSTRTENVSKTSQVKMEDWRIVVPSIELNAQISEGTSSDVMDEFVGHFENSAIWNGNVALAGHNRGYPVNYFSRIKELNLGEIIQYYYNGNLKEYEVTTVTIIEDTDWSYLDSTPDNRITLITCVEDEPEYRRCIQGVEI